MPGKRAAFFDFDKTLLSCESSKLLMRYMGSHRKVFFAQKGVSIAYVMRLVLMNEFYKRHLFSDEKMAILLIDFFKGRKISTFESIADDLYHKLIKPKLAPNILEIVLEHKKNGDVLIIVSAGIRYLLRVVAKDLGFDHLLCTDLEVDDNGMLTGRVSGRLCIGINKRLMCEELALNEGINLKSSFAYGNHQSDIPMLELVGNPNVVEPTGPLLVVAEKRGWPVLKY
jgi:HAD superfamily hydrolase (TIGR01490 family)